MNVWGQERRNCILILGFKGFKQDPGHNPDSTIHLPGHSPLKTFCFKGSGNDEPH